MSEIAFLAPRLTKGRFTIEATGEFRDFSLNPTTLSDSKSPNFASQSVPGVSNPVLQGGGGGDRTLSFVLRLDGDTGYRNVRRLAQQATNRKDRDPNLPGAEPVPLAIDDEISWYEQFLYTEGNARLGEPRAKPHVILFSFGSRYRGFRCVMTGWTLNVTKWTPGLSPSQADLQLTLTEKVLSSTARSTIWDAGRNTEF